ncbi:Transcription factor [Penicillium herquei]|nr:Transcription factor [Penicillium herquei]
MHGSIVPDSRLIRLFYENLHSAHPILVPPALFAKWNYPFYLVQVVKLIGSHYSMVLSNDLLHDATWVTLNENAERTPQKIQALLLYSIIMRARNDLHRAESSLSEAIDIAFEIGMYYEDFATKFSHGREFEAESLRRTWWELFIWELYMVTPNNASNLRCSDVVSTVGLPCEESIYSSLGSIPQPQSLSSFRARVFAADEDMIQFSSYAYRIEATRILARVIVFNSLPETQHDHLQALANNLISWLQHLPPQKIDAVDMYGNIDEMLFQAHFTIQYAAMLLHLPRSNIRPLFPNPALAICPVTPLRLSPSITRHVHDVKAIEASKRVSDLLSLRSDAKGYSPAVVFGSTLCGLVQLAAAEAHGSKCYEHHQNRVVLVLGCLKLLRDKWSLAREAQTHLRKTAARLAASVTEYVSPFEGIPVSALVNQHPSIAFEENHLVPPIPHDVDDVDGDTFSSRLLSEFVEASCGDLFSLFPMPIAERAPSGSNHQTN